MDGCRLQKARDEAMHWNWSFISGSAGKKAIQEFSSLVFDFRCAGWGHTNLNDTEKHEYCFAIFSAMGEAGKRLKDDFESQQKYRIFQAAADPSFNARVVAMATSPILDLHAQCDACVDPLFTLVWARRLVDHRESRKAFVCLHDILAVMPVVTNGTERKHLLGQECKPRKHGIALGATCLAMKTYARSATQAVALMTRGVTNECLGEDVRVRRRFGQVLAALNPLKCRRRGATDAARLADRRVHMRSFAAQPRTRKVYALDVFWKAEKRAVLDASSLCEKRRLLNAAWKN